ncbi:ectoine utilization protein EutA [Aureimonas fodinaquatilis]|uniref:Ectoine utilization protein EutA n=1 Tax=Aureimonas fodinaquatilis TaxID=2565783 RepID=A0A5B0DQ15_9HYPH|nr:ectoine utilization protein EutA [Aureimonas fodinaquatilis]KAA0968102.1 ectoine utilization protein EutA [Aureimonas fodinaquatilis]
MVAITKLEIPLGFDQRAVRKRIGLIVLATDHTTEADFTRLVASPEVGIYGARIAYANPTTPENLRAAAPRLAQAAALLLPDEELDVICFSCTSASVVIGDDAVAKGIGLGKPGVPVITPPLAVQAGLNAMGVRRISVLTPYTVETSVPMASYFADKGFEIASFSCLGLDDDRLMARLSPQTLVEAAVAAMADDAEALFISCTALRSAALVETVEQRIGRPVITSNQATAWACLAQCGVAAPANAGRLMRLPMAKVA